MLLEETKILRWDYRCSIESGSFNGIGIDEGFRISYNARSSHSNPTYSRLALKEGIKLVFMVKITMALIHLGYLGS